MRYLALATMLRIERASLTILALMCVAALPHAGCRSYEPRVSHMVTPVYPITAQSGNIEGTVDLIIQVGMDGRVLSVSEGAEGRGANRDLVLEAEENARQWVWGPFPAKFEFPWYHNIRYVFKLEGKPTPFPHTPPIVRTRLPNQLEIIAVPCQKTYLELEPAPASP